MKNLRPITLLLLLFCLASSAQNGKFKQKMEQVKTLKVAFITNELSLTPEESAKFWPIYNAFEEKQRAIRKQKMGSFIEPRKEEPKETMTDKEASALLAQIEKNEEEMHLLRKKLVTDLKTIIPAIKILKLKKAEEDFNKKLLQQYRNKGPKK